MKVTSGMVKELQRRIDVTYEEAEKVLLKTNGDIDRAEHILYRRKNSGASRLIEEVGRIYRESLTYYFKVSRHGKVVIDVPLLVVVGLFLIMTSESKIWVGVVSVGIVLISESSVVIHRAKEKEEDVEETVKDERDVTKDEDGLKTSTSDEDLKDEDDDDYYEITIKK